MDDQRSGLPRLVLTPNGSVGFVSRDLMYVSVTPEEPQLWATEQKFRLDLSLVLTPREAVELATKLLRNCGIPFEPPLPPPQHGNGPTS